MSQKDARWERKETGGRKSQYILSTTIRGEKGRVSTIIKVTIEGGRKIKFDAKGYPLPIIGE